MTEFDDDKNDILGLGKIPNELLVLPYIEVHSSITFKCQSIFDIGNYKNIRRLEEYNFWISWKYYNV